MKTELIINFLKLTKPKINGKIWTDMKKRAGFSLQFGVYHWIIVTQRQSQSHFSFPQTLLFSRPIISFSDFPSLYNPTHSLSGVFIKSLGTTESLWDNFPLTGIEQDHLSSFFRYIRRWFSAGFSTGFRRWFSYGFRRWFVGAPIRYTNQLWVKNR